MDLFHVKWKSFFLPDYYDPYCYKLVFLHYNIVFKIAVTF